MYIAFQSLQRVMLYVVEAVDITLVIAILFIEHAWHFKNIEKSSLLVSLWSEVLKV